MPAMRMDHVNIACRDLEKTRTFYCDVLGFTVGWRPEVAGFDGYWLYLDDIPCLHLGRQEDMAKLSSDRQAAYGAEGTGAVDHIALVCEDFEDIKAKLKHHDIAFSQNEVPSPDGIFRQIFALDPDGVRVELNFAP